MVVVAGPTASGKSALALSLAGAFGGTVINADSMQVYDGLRILTGRPDAADEARADVLVIGTLSPGPVLDALQRRQGAGKPVVAAWTPGAVREYAEVYA